MASLTRRQVIQSFAGTLLLGVLGSPAASAAAQFGTSLAAVSPTTSTSPLAPHDAGNRFAASSVDTPDWMAPNQALGSILGAHRLVTYYGNPWASSMGILGQLDKNGLVQALHNRAAQYASAGGKPVTPAIHMVVTTAQASPGVDGLYRARMPASVIGDYVNLAANNGMLFIADVQVGLSTVADEVAAIGGFLNQPHVHLALDPEFDMWGSQVPGQEIGHMTAAEVNHAIGVLANVAARTGQQKILVVHQFTPGMLPDKAAIGSDPRVDLAIVMDGFGGQSIKIQHYDIFVRDSAIKYGGIKLFFDWDANLMTPGEALSLTPPPDIIIYQ